MSKVAVVTDSNSGISQELADKMGISVLPMPFTIDGKEYFEGISLTQEEFYEYLKKDVPAFAGIGSESLEGAFEGVR